MTKRIKYTLEYPIRSSAHILFEFVSTSNGLQEWFADEVDDKNKQFFFTWGGNTEKADLLHLVPEEYVQFKWHYMSAGEYLEFRVQKSDVTGGTVLIITDFAEPNELKDQQQLWDSQIHELKHRIGS
jgi:uncharacterized protein YndB with AHSA1/START domain